MTGRNERYLALDGLRGVAALVVAMRHNPFFWNGPGPDTIFYEGFLAVDFFFILSGFIISHAYAKMLARPGVGWAFFFRRLARLYPLYLLSLFMMTLQLGFYIYYGAFNGTVAAALLLFALLFLPNPLSPGFSFPLNAAAWSLFSELVTNLAVGLIGRRLTGKVALWIAICFGIILAASASLGLFGFGTLRGVLDAGVTFSSTGAGLLRAFFGIFAGVAIRALFVAKQRRTKVPFFVVALALLAILATPQLGSWSVVFDLTIVLFVLPALVYLGATIQIEGRVARACAWLGAISYGVYVLHVPVYAFGSPLVARLTVWFMGGNSIAAGCLSLVCVALVAWAAERFIDAPIRAFVSKSNRYD